MKESKKRYRKRINSPKKKILFAAKIEADYIYYINY